MGRGVQLRLRSRTRPPSGGAERRRGWGTRGRVAPQLRSARQPAGQTKGLPAKGGVISPQLGVLECELQTPDSQHLADFFFPLPQSKCGSNVGFWCPTLEQLAVCPDEKGSLSRTREGKSSGGRGR